MDQAPIDIRYSALLQWLEDRYQIPKDWPTRLELIVAKKKEILALFFQSETEEMKKLQNTFKSLQSSSFDTLSYLDYQKLNTQLIKTDAAKEKTLLRNYSNPLIYSSYVLTNIYLKNNMNLAEASKIIIQIITYDIPLCKKQMVDLSKSIQENNGRAAEKEDQIKRNSEKIKSILKSNEIAFDIEKTTSNQIASSLIDRLMLNDEFERKVEAIERAIKGNGKVKQAIEMYCDFYKAVNSITNSELSLVDTLAKVTQEGDYAIGSNENSAKPDRTAIIEAKVSRYRLKYSDQGETKGWNIATVGDNLSSSLSSGVNTRFIQAEKGNDSGLLNKKARELLIADLEEVSIFLKERLSKADNKDEINLMMYQQAFKDYNCKYTEEEMNANVCEIEKVLSLLTAKDFLFLTSLYNDEDSIKTITETYAEIKIQNSKLRNMIADLKKKSEEISEEIKDNEKKVTDLRKTAVTLRKATEIALTKSLKRKISIIGDENLL